jgi:hypothetical protein
VVECTGLENQQSRKVLVGSNPTASAMLSNTGIYAATPLVQLAYSFLATSFSHFSRLRAAFFVLGRAQIPGALKLLGHFASLNPGLTNP